MVELNSDFQAMLPGKVQETDELCPIHHIPLVEMSWSGAKPFCIKCRHLRIEQEEREKVERLQRKLYWRRTKQVLNKDSIFSDPDLKPATFANFKPSSPESEKNLKLARHWAGEYLNPDNAFNVILTGLPGRGKSHLALSMLKAVNENGQRPMSCLFVSVNDLFRLIRDSFNFPDSKYTEENMVNLLGNVDLLVLDDLGSEASFKRATSEASEFVQRTLFGILDQRQRTIITTNLTSKQLAAIYNPKIISRLEKNIRGHIISFTEATPDSRERIEF